MSKSDPLGVMLCMSVVEAKSLDAVREFDVVPDMLEAEASAMLKKIMAFYKKKGRTPLLSSVLRWTEADLNAIFSGDVPEELDSPDVYAQEVRDRFLGKTVADGIRSVTKALRKSPKDGAEVLRSVSNNVRRAGLLRSEQLVDINSAKQARAMRAEYDHAKKFSCGISGLTTLAPSLDEKSLGWQPGQLIVLCAVEKQGKTTYAVANTVHAFNNFGPPLIWTGEESIDEIRRRVHATNCGISYEYLRAGKLGMFGEKKWYSYLDKLEAGGADPFHVTDITVAKDVESIAQIAMDLEVKCVFVDGLYIMARRGADSMWERTVNVIADCKEWAKLTGVPWVVTTQLAGTLKKDVLNASTGDLGYAKAIAQYADVVLGLFSNKDLRKNKRRVLRTLCARNFVPVDMLINFDMDRMDFTELGIIEGDHVSRVAPVTISSGTVEEDEEDEEDEEETSAGPSTIAIPF